MRNILPFIKWIFTSKWQPYTSWKWFKSLHKVFMVSFWTEPFLVFLIFMKKNSCKKKKVRKNYFDEQEKRWTYLKIFWKKNWTILGYSKPKILSVSHSSLCSTKTNPKILILEVSVYEIQSEIINSKIVTRFNFITKPSSQKWNYH